VIVGRSGPAANLTLACTDTCHAVYVNLLGVQSWNGTGAPVAIAPNKPHTYGYSGLLGVDGQGGQLRLAIQQPKNPSSPDDGQRLVLESGDANGRHLRTIGSNDIPSELFIDKSHVYTSSASVTELTPAGLIDIALFMPDEPGKPNLQIATVVP
jgi:hypothetical protein